LLHRRGKHNTEITDFILFRLIAHATNAISFTYWPFLYSRHPLPERFTLHHECRDY